MRHRIGYPVRIRGTVYPSMIAAARAMNVHCKTISRALDEGWIDDVGIVRRKGGHPGTPCVYRGRRYPSVTAAAQACGVSKSAVSAANIKLRSA
jgi:hypothetical protein